MNWFKFYGQEYLTDPKMMSLTPNEKALWLTLLCLGSNNNGTIEYIDEYKIMTLTGFFPYDEEWDKNINFLKKFETLSMITCHDTNNKKTIVITNYDERQNTNLSPYERVKKSREKKKIEAKNDNKLNVINDNARIDKNRIDKNILSKDNKKLAKASSFGNPEINNLLEEFKRQFALPLLDGSEKENRNYANLLLKKIGGFDKAMELIKLASQDEWYKNNLSSIKSLYYNSVKIIARKRGDRPVVAVMPKEGVN